MTLCRAGSVSTEKGPWEGRGPLDHISVPMAVLMGFSLWPAVPQGSWTTRVCYLLCLGLSGLIGDQVFF